jgi:hypothetical protein
MRKLSAAIALVLASCGQGSPTWTLYRNGIGGGDRIHMATFDADDTGGGTHMFNQINCAAAMGLFQNAANKKAEGSDLPPVAYWCEEGGYSATPGER